MFQAGRLFRRLPGLARPGITKLFLEQILECRSRIIRTRSRRRRSFFLPCHANFVERAVIACVFLGDALLDWLHALKSATRIEIRALLARMQGEPAFRTLPFARACRSLQHRATLSTARYRPRPRQIDRFVAKRIIPLRRTALALRRCLPRSFFSRILALGFPITILIAVLPIFRHNLPEPPQGGYCLANALPAQVRCHPERAPLLRESKDLGAPIGARAKASNKTPKGRILIQFRTRDSQTKM